MVAIARRSTASTLSSGCHDGDRNRILYVRCLRARLTVHSWAACWLHKHLHYVMLVACGTGWRACQPTHCICKGMTHHTPVMLTLTARFTYNCLYFCFSLPPRAEG